MEKIVGIDLGTTNSAIAIIRDGKPIVLRGGENTLILPSVVGFSNDGQLLVGVPAKNQALLAPERTVKSVKRKMGQEERISLADREYSPQEVSAMILRTLKDRAEAQLGHPVGKAVITVPAYFTENQRTATREAGELAGLEVVRIINEPTAAALIYEPHSEKNEKLLVYDLGGGTFDVSIVQIEQGVIEVLASHGDTSLGGDDFDQLLLDYVCDEFQEEHGIDLRKLPVARSRMLQAVEEAKKQLSNEVVVVIAEEFIAEKEGRPLNLEREIKRSEYEQLILPLLEKTLTSVDASLADAHLTPGEIDRVVLVGGSSRTPLVHQLMRQQLQHEPHLEIDPDLCVAMGAAVQGALIAGADVGAVLVDITPHTLGIRCAGHSQGRYTQSLFSAIIPRNTALPATRSEMYYTNYQGQTEAQISVYQGEHQNTTFNKFIGEFLLDGLDKEAREANEILVRFDLNLDGILTVTAIERDTGLEKQLRLENAITRFHRTDRQEAQEKLAEVFGVSPALLERPSSLSPDDSEEQSDELPTDQTERKAHQILDKARQLLPQASEEDAEEIHELITRNQEAQSSGNPQLLDNLLDELEDVLFYVEDV